MGRTYRQAKQLYEADISRYNDAGIWLKLFHFSFRYCQIAKSKKPATVFFSLVYSMLTRSRGIEIPFSATIGRGFKLNHVYGITINPLVEMGMNCDISKGATLGEEYRGIRKGCPSIGNRVWIGSNAMVVGKITIGDDVLIAPNAFVNRDVPSSSIVFGNPCIIKHKENATEGYTVNPIVY